MSLDSKSVLQRIDQLLAVVFPTDTIFPTGTEQNLHVAVVEVYQGTLTLARSVYGDGTPQVHTLMEAAKSGRARWAPLLTPLVACLSLMFDQSLPAHSG